MLTILYEWKNSLTLFKKDTLLLILYSWYKLTVQVYKDLFVHFWWLIIPIPGFLTYNYINRDDAPISTAVGGVLFIIMYYIAILLARPTLEKKDRRYVLNKGLGYLGFVIITLFLYRLSTFVSAGLITIIFIPLAILNAQFFTALLLSLLTFFKAIELFLWVWILLFLLDSKGSIRDCFNAIWHGYKMVLFNVPITIILAGFLVMLYYVLVLIGQNFSVTVQDVLNISMSFIAITLIVTIYIKRVHDQCSLYFGRGEVFTC